MAEAGGEITTLPIAVPLLADLPFATKNRCAMLTRSFFDPDSTHRLELAFGLLVTSVAIGVRLLLSAGLYLNPDEAVHLSAACAKAWNIHHHPPLLLWWAWIVSHFSQSELWLRSLPSISGGLFPLALTVWLRFYVTRSIAWTIGLIAGFSPFMIMLTMQLRGYSLALLFTLAALICLELLLRQPTRRWTVAHFAFLALAALSEFVVVFPIASVFLLTMARLRGSAPFRPLKRWIFAGYACLAVLYAWLFFYIVLPVSRQPVAATNYVSNVLWQPGGNPLYFILNAVCGQFAYLTSGWVAGAITTILFIHGLAVCLRRKEDRGIIFATVLFGVLAAWIGTYPMGYTRHAVVVGVIGLGAVAIGMDSLFSRSKALAAGAAAILVASWLVYPSVEEMNIPLNRWQKRGWNQAITMLTAQVPRGSTIFMNRSLLESLKATILSREELASVGPASYFARQPTRTVVSGYFIVSGKTTTLLGQIAKPTIDLIEEIERTNPSLPDRIWIAGGGWKLERPCIPHLQLVIDRPELWLGSVSWKEFKSNYTTTPPNAVIPGLPKLSGMSSSCYENSPSRETR